MPQFSRALSKTFSRSPPFSSSDKSWDKLSERNRQSHGQTPRFKFLAVIWGKKKEKEWKQKAQADMKITGKKNVFILSVLSS